MIGHICVRERSTIALRLANIFKDLRLEAGGYEKFGPKPGFTEYQLDFRAEFPPVMADSSN